MVARLSCLFCATSGRWSGQTWLNLDSVIKHCASDHHPQLNTAEAIYGHQCPLCGKTFEALGGHTGRTHKLLLPLAFDIARAKDEHGVIADRLAVLTRLTLHDAETAVDRLTRKEQEHE